MNRRHAALGTLGLAAASLALATRPARAQEPPPAAGTGYTQPDLDRNVDAFLAGTPLRARHRARPLQIIREIGFDIEYQQDWILISAIDLTIDPNYPGEGDTHWGLKHAEAIRSGKPFDLSFSLRGGPDKADFGSASLRGISDAQRIGSDGGWRYRLGPRKAALQLKQALPAPAWLKANIDGLNLWTYVNVAGDTGGSGSGPSLFNQYLRT